jgi:hypothetical protein
MRYVVGFGRFWYDFIVGDSAVLAAGGAAVLVLGFLVARAMDSGPVEVLLPLIVIATIALSLRS